MSKKVAGKKRMTQGEVLQHLAERTRLNREQVKELFNGLVDLATDEVRANDEFILPGLGKLVLSERRARQGRNPQTGETIHIPAKTTLKFRLAKSVKDLAGDPTKRGKP